MGSTRNTRPTKSWTTSLASTTPQLVPEYNIPLDEYPRRCVKQIEDWKKMGKDLASNPRLGHTRSRE